MTETLGLQSGLLTRLNNDLHMPWLGRIGISACFAWALRLGPPAHWQCPLFPLVGDRSLALVSCSIVITSSYCRYRYDTDGIARLKSQLSLGSRVEPLSSVPHAATSRTACAQWPRNRTFLLLFGDSLVTGDCARIECQVNSLICRHLELPELQHDIHTFLREAS